MTSNRPAPARATTMSSRQALNRRDFLGLAAAAVAGIGGIALLGGAGSAHDGHDAEGTPMASPAATPMAAAAPFAIATMDIRFEPNALVIPANIEVTIEVTNHGVMPHDVIIPALGVNSGRLQSGQTVAITVNAGPGAYPFHCSVPGHRQAGMRGTLTVE